MAHGWIERRLRILGLAVLPALFISGCSPTVPASGSPTAAAIDEAQAGAIARRYFAATHGTGVTLSNVRETDLGITGDTSCGSAWEIVMEGTVTESGGASYGSVMYLCVDPVSGAVTRGPAG